MITRFILVVFVVAALYGGWLYTMDWTDKYHAKLIIKRVAVSVILAVITVLTLILLSSNISGI